MLARPSLLTNSQIIDFQRILILKVLKLLNIETMPCISRMLIYIFVPSKVIPMAIFLNT